jgi:hypothetical protein
MVNLSLYSLNVNTVAQLADIEAEARAYLGRLQSRMWQDQPHPEMRTKRSGGKKIDQQGVNVLSSPGV